MTHVLLMVHGPHASPPMNRSYYVLFRVPCFGSSLIMSCLVPHQNVLGPCPCRATCRPAHWPSIGWMYLNIRINICKVCHNSLSLDLINLTQFFISTHLGYDNKKHSRTYKLTFFNPITQ